MLLKITMRATEFQTYGHKIKRSCCNVTTDLYWKRIKGKTIQTQDSLKNKRNTLWNNGTSTRDRRRITIA